MRVAILSIILALCCAILPVSAQAISQSYHLDIPREPLDGALKDLAQQTGLQIARLGDTPDGSAVVGPLRGDMLIGQALGTLLAKSALTYKVVNERTIAVVAANSSAAVSQESRVSSSPSAESGKEGKKESSDTFRVAQASPGQDATNATVEQKKEDRKKDDEINEILVTGSRLKTTDAATASPLQVITAVDIKNMGFNTVEDVLHSLSQNNGTLNSQTTRDPQSTFAQDSLGQSAADLRGLGPENTLILVNGHRRAASSTFGSVVNLNTIPIGSIERIEILTDGASAVYGSDAIGGVINFILKKNYQGGETHVRQELGANGGDSTTLEQSLGTTWSSGNVTFSGRFSKLNPVRSSRAGYTTSDFTSHGGDNWDLGFAGQPGTVISASDFSTLGCLPAGDNGTNGVAGKLSPANCVPYDLATNVRDVVPGQKQYSIDLNAEQNLTSWARAYGEFSFSRNTSQAKNGPSTNQYMLVPATNRYNDLGQSVYVSSLFTNETQRGLLPSQEISTGQKALAGVLGVKFDLPKGWTLDISANHSREDTSFDILRIDPAVLATRLSGVDTNGNPIPADQQINVFGNGTAQNPAAMAGLMTWGQPGWWLPDNYSTNDSGLLTAEGSLLKLPGGDVRVALGGEFRREALYYNNSSYASLYVSAEPSRTNKAAFGELNVPLVGEHNRIPGIYALNLYGAARGEQYSIKGPFDGTGAAERTVTFSQVSPKAGFSWYPIEPLKVRATYSRSFLAPQLSNLFGSTTGPYNFIPYVDPNNPGQGSVYPNTLFTGNPNLKPETANSFTGGLDWKPSGVLRGLAATVTYSYINFTNRIANAFDYYYTPLFYSLPGVIVRDANGNISQVNVIPVNVATRRSRSVDLSLSYGFDTEMGQLTFGVAGTDTLKLEDSDGSTSFVRLDGTQSGPERIKARAWTGWSRGQYGLNWYANYTSSYTNTNALSPSLLAPQPVAHYTTFDLNGFYELPKGFSVHAGVRNLTNAAFPFINNGTVPWDSRIVDLRGRIFYLEFASKYGQ